MLKHVDLPLFQDYWERLNKSLEYLAEKKQRTCIRLTIIKEINDKNHKEYANLIHKGNPDFIEVKAYMHVGASKDRLKKENMPFHEYIIEFTKELLNYLPDYDIVSEHIPSRVIMLAKKSFKKNNKWYTWIDFKKYNKLVNEKGGDFTTEEYLALTPHTGLRKRNKGKIGRILVKKTKNTRNQSR